LVKTVLYRLRSAKEKFAIARTRSPARGTRALPNHSQSNIENGDQRDSQSEAR
jgi:hypothetical protein